MIRRRLLMLLMGGAPSAYPLTATGIATGAPTVGTGTLALAYLLNAPFTASNQNYSDAQVLNTVAEGITAGQLTVVEKDGTLAVVSNKCAFTVQGTPALGDLALVSLALTKSLGMTLYETLNIASLTAYMGFWDDANTIGNNRVYSFLSSTTWLARTYDGAGNQLESVSVAAFNADTDYQLCLVLGGYDSNGVPWRTGETAANYLYGAAWYVKGSTFSTWTLLWRTALVNISTLYAALSTYNAAGTIDDFRIPTDTLESVLQPTAMSTFTAANGTSLDAITPEVGGTWT